MEKRHPIVVLSVAFLLTVLPESRPAADSGSAAPVAETREHSIQRFESLLDRYPESEMRAPVLLLLGNMYAERARDRYLEAALLWEDGIAAEQPRIDYGDAIRVYEEFVSSHGEFAGRTEALYALGVCLEEMGLSAEAHGHYTSIAQSTDEEAYRLASSLRLADMDFAAGKWRDALEGYRRADQLGADRARHKIDYKTGWCYLKLGDLSKAATRLRVAADRAYEHVSAGTGGEALGEVLRSLALVQAEIDPDDVDGFAARFTETDYRRAALAALGEALLDVDRPASAERAWRACLAMEPLAPDAPVIHDKIIETMTLRNQKNEAGLEMEAHYETYRSSGKWWLRHADDRDLSGDALRRMTRNVWNAALVRVRAGGTENLENAAKLFEIYVDELQAGADRNRALLFAAESWHRADRPVNAIRCFDRIDVMKLEGDERRNALRGAAQAELDAGSLPEHIALAAIKWVKNDPGDEEAEKAVLLAAEGLETEGELRLALSLCARVAEHEGSSLRSDAAARAGKISSLLENHTSAERWFLDASNENSGSAKSELHARAAASAFLAAGTLEEEERWSDAATSYSSVRLRYGSSEVVTDAILREMVCRTQAGEGGVALELADSLVSRTPGDAQSRDAIRHCAVLAADGGDFEVSAHLLESAYKVIPDGEDLFQSGIAWQNAGRSEEAVGAYARVAAIHGKGVRAGEAHYRRATLLETAGDDAGAAAAYESCLAAGGTESTAPVELLVRAAEAHEQAGDESASIKLLHAAIAAFEEHEEGGDDDRENRAAYHVAKAHLRLASRIQPELVQSINEWRNGGVKRAPATELERFVTHMRAGIEQRFAETTEPAVRDLAGVLALYGRAAHLREWDRGNIPDVNLVDPYLEDASALLTGLGEHPSLYADVADTMVAAAGEMLATNPPPAAGIAGDEHSDLLAAHLSALDRAHERWRAAFAFIDLQGEIESSPRSAMARKKATLAIEAAERQQGGADLLRSAAPPEGLTESEKSYYEELIEEKARIYEDRALHWIESIGDTSPSLAGSGVSEMNGVKAEVFVR